MQREHQIHPYKDHLVRSPSADNEALPDGIRLFGEMWRQRLSGWEVCLVSSA